MQNSPQLQKKLIQSEEDYLLSVGWIKKTDINSGKSLWFREDRGIWVPRDSAIFEQKHIENNNAIRNKQETIWEV